MIIHKVPPQLWCSRTENGKFRCTPPKNNPASNKPVGGCWTSTFTPDAEWCSDWLEWCSVEEPDWLTGNCEVLIPKDNVRVFVLNSLKDLKELYSKYGEVVEENGRKYYTLNWEKMAKDLDGVWLTKEGVKNLTRQINAEVPDLYGWDAESIVWFRDVFRKKIPINKVKRRCRVK